MKPGSPAGWHDWGILVGSEIGALKAALGWSDAEAQAFVVIRYAKAGDLRPLGAVFGGNYFHEDTCMPAIAKFLVKLIEADRLRVVQTRRGAGEKPDALVRDVLIGVWHECGMSVAQLKDQFRVSEKTVELAITKAHKSRKLRPN